MYCIHVGMWGIVRYDGSASETLRFETVKQGCVRAPTLFGFFFPHFLTWLWEPLATKGIYLQTHSEGKLFNLKCLKAKTEVWKVLIHEPVFADDAA